MPENTHTITLTTAEALLLGYSLYCAAGVTDAPLTVRGLDLAGELAERLLALAEDCEVAE